MTAHDATAPEFCPRAALRQALSATDDARAHLQRYGDSTDDPASGTVDVADLLDVARGVLAEVVL